MNCPTHTHTHTHTREHSHTRAFAHASIYRHTRTREHSHTRTREHSHTRTREHSHTRTTVLPSAYAYYFPQLTGPGFLPLPIKKALMYWTGLRIVSTLIPQNRFGTSEGAMFEEIMQYALYMTLQRPYKLSGPIYLRCLNSMRRRITACIIIPQRNFS